MSAKDMFTTFRTGDLVLYSGRHPMHLLHQKRTGCPWGQVGLIVRLSSETVPIVFESTAISQAEDVRTGAVAQGVQLTRLPDRIASFDGAVAIRHLVPPLDEDLESRLHTFVENQHGKPFNSNKWIAFRSLNRRNVQSREPGYFCSELVAEAFQSIGILPRPPEGMTSNNYIPADFSSGFSRSILKPTRGFQLGNEEIIKVGLKHLLINH